MTAAADRYRNLADQMEARIAAVPADRWESASPCEGWTARGVVRHLVDTAGAFLGFAGLPAPEGGPSVDDDPLGAFQHARGAVQRALDDPAVANAEFDGMMGRTTLTQMVERFGCGDLLIHGWDLARATGQDEALDPTEVSLVFAGLQQAGDMIRSPGVFGPAVEAPADADEQTRFLSFIGRRP